MGAGAGGAGLGGISAGCGVGLGSGAAAGTSGRVSLRGRGAGAASGAGTGRRSRRCFRWGCCSVSGRVSVAWIGTLDSGRCVNTVGGSPGLPGAAGGVIARLTGAAGGVGWNGRAAWTTT
jgi:hypothetical protein